MTIPNTQTASTFFSSSELAWWKKATAYQIYPRSFCDSNGDGIGDLPGILSKLDYLSALGIDLLWICPFYQSPNDDNGYDISDYQAIHPDFGTLSDVDTLIQEAHKRGIRIILDLVINHTSDEHPWFIESRQSKNSPKRDWYIWRDGSAPTQEKPTQDPNNWESIFHGSAWEYDEGTSQYYLHLFSKKQPDLNWQNPDVKNALFEMVQWWIARGIDGFRVDAISHIQKQPGLPSLPNPTGEKYVSSFDYHMNVAGIEAPLSELRDRAFAPFDIVTVGEANGVAAEDALPWVAEETEAQAGGIFNMIFQFEHMTLWAEEETRNHFDLINFKRILSRWQNALEGKGWNALYLENHDQARSINTFADPTHWYGSATALAACYFLMKGTPFIYQGQEIGVTNHAFTHLDQFQDVSARNLITKLRQKGQNDTDILLLLNQVSRDHSRLPMQWDNSEFAGFSSVQPWINVSDSTKTVNVAQQQNDPNSVWRFYQRLIALRKTHESLITGRYQLLLETHPQLYVYQRHHPKQTWTIITNLSNRSAFVDLDLAHLGECVLHNQDQAAETTNFLHEQMALPYAAYVFVQNHTPDNTPQI